MRYQLQILMMSATKNGEGYGANKVGSGLVGPQETEHSPNAIVPPGKPVVVRAGAGVSETGQVNKTAVGLSPSDINLDAEFSSIDITERNTNQVIRDSSRAASSILATGNNWQEAESQTVLGNSLNDSENDIFESKNISNDDFSPNRIEYFETSLNPADITVIDPNISITNYDIIKEKVKYSGAEVKKFKRQKRDEARKELLANETIEEANKRKYVEGEYNIRNKSYAQAAKAAGGRMLEVRSHNQDYLLQQEDYNKIDTSCGMKFLEQWKTGDKGDYYMKGGLSQGGVWISCKNDETLALVKEFIGTLTSPNEEGGRFKVYGEGEKPFLYIQAWIPGRWWEMRDQLFELICFSNRWLVDPLEDGQVPHFRLSSGLNKRKMNDKGFFECTFEVDENIFPLIAQKKGEFHICMSTTKFFGSGIVAAAKRLLMEEYDRMIDGSTD